MSTQSAGEAARQQLRLQRERVSRALPSALISGTSGAICSAAVLALLGKAVAGTAAGPLNGPTQLLAGERSARDRRVSVKTAVGLGLHHLIAIGWATLHEAYVAPRARGRGIAAQLAAGGITAAVAYGADYGIARGRLQPGFEKHLGRASRIAAYAALAVGFALPAIVRSRRPGHR
jgi:GNAT superfamily N-acetyltransferase